MLRVVCKYGRVRRTLDTLVNGMSIKTWRRLATTIVHFSTTTDGSRDDILVSSSNASYQQTALGADQLLTVTEVFVINLIII